MASIITSDTLKTAKSLLSAKSIRAGAKGEREADYFMAERLLEKARERVAKGTREAKEIARQGRMLESDALAAMGGMGMASDPVLLAKIKAKSDYNALAALFEAGVESRGMKQQAIETRYAGRMKYAASIPATAGAALTGVSAIGDSFAKWMKKRPVGVQRLRYG